MAFQFNYFKWACYLNGKPLQQSVGRCHYCSLENECFYNPKISSLKHGVIKICKNADENIKHLNKQLVLIDYLLSLNVCDDVKSLIGVYIYNYDINNGKTPCLEMKIYQDCYLGLKFTDLSIVELKRLIHTRQLKCPKNKNKMDHINILQQDLYEKRFIWRGISY